MPNMTWLLIDSVVTIVVLYISAKRSYERGLEDGFKVGADVGSSLSNKGMHIENIEVVGRIHNGH